MGWREGKRRVRVTWVCVCVCITVLRLIKNNSSSSASLVNSRSPWQLLCSALTFPFSLSLSLCLASVLLLLQWATLFSSPHTRHKSMFDFHNNNNNSISRREIRKAMRKKKQQNEETARRSRQGHGTRDTGDRTQDIMFAPCLKFLPLVCVIFILYTFFSAFSCAAFHLMRYTFFCCFLAANEMH